MAPTNLMKMRDHGTIAVGPGSGEVIPRNPDSAVCLGFVRLGKVKIVPSWHGLTAKGAPNLVDPVDRPDCPQWVMPPREIAAHQ